LAAFINMLGRRIFDPSKNTLFSLPVEDERERCQRFVGAIEMAFDWGRWTLLAFSVVLCLLDRVAKPLQSRVVREVLA